MEEIQKTQVAGKNSKKKMSNKTRSICIASFLGAVIVAGIIAIVVVLVNKNSGSDLEDIVVNGQTLSEEEKRVTKETIQEYIEMEVKGYQHIDTDNGGYNAVVIEVKNRGNKRTSLAIEVVARNKDDNSVLDTSSMYAEGIEPGQTYTFHTFVYSKVPADQLKEAKFDIYKANTYEAVEAEEQPTEDESVEEEPVEEPDSEPEPVEEQQQEEQPQESETTEEQPQESETTEEQSNEETNQE